MNLDFPRALSSAEAGVLNLILSAEFAGVESLRAQVGGLLAVGQCDCGCPTIDVAADPSAVPAVGLDRRVLPAEAVVRSYGDEPVGELIVFVDDGLLSGIEYVYYGDTPPVEWPGLDRVTLR